MTIQFDCPGCQSAVRVADSFAGKKGKCPGCGTLIRIPQLPQSPPLDPAPEPPQTPPAPPENIGAADGTALPPADQFRPPGAAAADKQPTTVSGVLETTEFPQVAETRPTTSRRRRKRRTNPAMALVPLALCGALIGLLIWQSLPDTYELAGEVDGSTVSGGRQFSAAFPEKNFRGIVERYNEVLDSVAADPEILLSRSVRGSIESDKTEFRVTVRIQPEHRWVALSPSDIPQWDNWFRVAGASLAQQRTAAAEAAAEAFLRDQSTMLSGGLVSPDVQKYRNDLIFNLLGNTASSALEAIVNRTVVLPVRADDSGRVWFALPKSVEEFQVRIRELPGTIPAFPGTLTVRILESEEVVEGDPVEDEAGLEQGENPSEDKMAYEGDDETPSETQTPNAGGGTDPPPLFQLDSPPEQMSEGSMSGESMSGGSNSMMSGSMMEKPDGKR